jgi:hypothetical protein
MGIVPHRDPQPQLIYRNGQTRKIRYNYLKANVWELFVCALSAIASINYFINPINLSNSSIGHTRFPDEIWNSMYGVGAVIVVLGLWRLSPRLEICGLMLFATSVLINALAIGHYRGWSTSASTLAVLMAFFAAASVRMADVVFSYRRTLRHLEQLNGPRP